MTVQCQIENPWGVETQSPAASSTGMYFRRWGESEIYFFAASTGTIISIIIDDLVPNQDVVAVNSLVFRHSGRSIYDNTVYPSFYKDGENVANASRSVPSEIEFDDYYAELTGIRFNYLYEVEGVRVPGELVVNFDTGVKIRTIPDMINALETAGLIVNSSGTFHTPQIRCVDIDTGETTVNVVGSFFPGTPVEVIRIDGTPPPSRIADGNSSIFIDPAGAVRMQAANDEGQPLASFFLTEHGAGGFNVTGSFFANGNREASFGGGGHTFTLDSRGYTFRHNREEVTFTFEDMQRLKELIG